MPLAICWMDAGPAPSFGGTQKIVSCSIYVQSFT